MEENRLWGYRSIYGDQKPEYHESFDREMREALDYLCARVKRCGDFWDALQTASAMYGVNRYDLRNNFEKRKKAGIERKEAERRKNENWFAIRYSSGPAFRDEEAGWMLLKETDPEKARQTVIRRNKTPDCTISIEACLPFKTKDEAANFTASWDKEHAVRQLPLWDFSG